MLSANINTRGGIRKRLYVHKIEQRGGFSKVKCILISILSESPFLNEVHFKWKSIYLYVMFQCVSMQIH